MAQTPKKAAVAPVFGFTSKGCRPRLRSSQGSFAAKSYRGPLGGSDIGQPPRVGSMGIAMKKVGFTLAAVLALGGSAYAADMKMPLKAVAPPVVVSPWDFAFGAAITNDYRFRGIAQSNRQPSVSAYFEPRYNVHDSLQLYAG